MWTSFRIEGQWFQDRVTRWHKERDFNNAANSQEETNSRSAPSSPAPDAVRSRRGCHSSIYDRDVERRQEQLSALYHRRALLGPRSGHCFKPFDENNAAERGGSEGANRVVPGGTLKHFCLPVSADNDLVKEA